MELLQENKFITKFKIIIGTIFEHWVMTSNKYSTLPLQIRVHKGDGNRQRKSYKKMNKLHLLENYEVLVTNSLCLSNKNWNYWRNDAGQNFRKTQWFWLKFFHAIVHSEKICFVLILIYPNYDDPSRNILPLGKVCFKNAEFVFFSKMPWKPDLCL